MTTFEANQVAKVKLRGFNLLQGLLLDIGDEWLKIQHIPVDFVVDGVAVIHKRYVVNIERDKDDLFVEKVIRLKNIIPTNNSNFNLDNETALFKNLMSQNQLIQIYFHEDRISYVGKIVKINTNSFTMRLLSTNAEWLKDYSFKYSSVRIIHISNDYVDSLSLLIGK